MKKKKKIILVSFTYLFFSSIETVQGFLSLRSIFFGNSDLEKEKKKKKNRSEESSTGKSRSKTGMETSIVIKKLATSLSRLIIRIIVVVLSRLRVRSKLFREKKK